MSHWMWYARPREEISPIVLKAVIIVVTLAAVALLIRAIAVWLANWSSPSVDNERIASFLDHIPPEELRERLKHFPR